MLVEGNFDFTKNYVLEDERVILSPATMPIIQSLKEYVNNEPEIWKYSLVGINNIDDLNGYFESAIEARKHKTAYPFVVFDKQLNKYVGSTRFYDIQLAFETTQLGYTWYSKQVWGTGLNQHCKYLLLQFAFDQMNLKRVEFRADNDNKRSIAAMKKIGCTEEGVLKSHLPRPDGSRRDSIVLSITKDDWDGKVKSLLQSQL